MTLLNPPRPHTLAPLTDAQFDRLYLDWQPRLHQAVTAALHAAQAADEHTLAQRERAFTALRRDLTAIPITAPREIPYGGPAARALDAQASLRNAQTAYAQGRYRAAVSHLQQTALDLRELETAPTA